MVYEFKAVQKSEFEFTVIKFYRSANLGECHVAYMDVIAVDEDAAIHVAKDNKI